MFKKSPSLIYAYLLAFIAVWLGMALRFDQLAHVPPGYTFDEASHALDAQDLLRGHWTLLSSRLEQTAMGYMYLLAVIYALWNDTPLVSRVFTAICGTLLIPVNFWAIRQLFQAALGRVKATWLASWSSLLITSSFWAVVASRLGYEYILTPVVQLVALALFWSGYQGKSWAKIAAAACFSASNYYLYDGAMSFLLVIPVSIIGHEVLSIISKPIIPLEHTTWRDKIGQIFLFCSLSLLIVAPLLWASFGGDTPAMDRTQRKLIFSQVTTTTEGLELLWRGTWVHLQPFLALDGSSRWLMNLSRRPILEPLLAVSFIVGIGLCFWHIKQWPYFMMLIYWAGMLAPNVLTYEGSPRYFRMIGMLPATYLFIALAWVEGQSWLAQQSPRRAWLILLPLLGWSLLWLPGQTYYDYFITWARHPRVQMEHDMEVIQLIERMQQETDPQAIFLLPRTADNPRHNFVIDYLYHGAAGFQYIVVDGAETQAHLTAAVANYQTVYYIKSLQGARERNHYSTEYPIIPWLLTQHGKHLKTETTSAYTLEVYRLHSTQEDFRRAIQTTLPDGFEPLDLTLIDSVKLAGWRYQADGQRLTIELAWQGITQIPIDFTVFIHLVDATGQPAGGVDVGVTRGIKSDTSQELLIVPYSIPGSHPAGTYTATVGLYYFEANQQMKPMGSVVLPPLVIP